MRRLTLAVSVGLSLLVTSAAALACPRGENVISDRVVERRDVRVDALTQAAALEADARTSDQRALAHTQRAASLRAAADALQENVPVAFGDAREAILERIDALLERAAVETGEARTERLRASQLRAQAARLRAQVRNGGGGGGWRGRGRPVDDVVVPVPVAPPARPTTIDI